MTLAFVTNLERWPQLRNKLDYDGVQRLRHKWKDYGGLIFLLLLLRSLEEAGVWMGVLHQPPPIDRDHSRPLYSPTGSSNPGSA
jgi:hypothetical protein